MQYHGLGYVASDMDLAWWSYIPVKLVISPFSQPYNSADLKNEVGNFSLTATGNADWVTRVTLARNSKI